LDKQRRIKKEYEQEKNEEEERKKTLNISLTPTPATYYIINGNFQENFPYFIVPLSLF